MLALCGRIFLIGVDKVVRAPPILEPRLNLLASSQVTMDEAPRLDRLKTGVHGSSGFTLPLRGNSLQPSISPPDTIITSVVRLGGVESLPKYGQVHGGGSSSPSSELLDFAVNAAGANRPSLLSSSDALLGLFRGVFGSTVAERRRLS